MSARWMTITTEEYRRFGDRLRRADECIHALRAQVVAADAERSARSDASRRAQSHEIAMLRRDLTNAKAALAQAALDTAEARRWQRYHAAQAAQYRAEAAWLRDELGSTAPDVVERFRHAVGAA